ncbi:MAG: hypothetical protein DHS20C18_32570 [Saprospiraceae bacterium]|nr:MAG: hypothetical protein DHS20C18_32570 [Saprospiraceae bacterium]
MTFVIFVSMTFKYPLSLQDNMKKFFSISLLILFLGQGFYLGLLSGYLSWEREYIIDKYCINKDKPLLLCSGRCYINEVLGEELESGNFDQSTAPTVTVERPSLTLFCEQFSPIIVPAPTSEGALNSHYNYLYYYHPVSSIFHPPRFSSFFAIEVV